MAKITASKADSMISFGDLLDYNDREFEYNGAFYTTVFKKDQNIELPSDDDWYAVNIATGELVMIGLDEIVRRVSFEVTVLEYTESV